MFAAQKLIFARQGEKLIQINALALLRRIFFNAMNPAIGGFHGSNPEIFEPPTLGGLVLAGVGRRNPDVSRHRSDG
jgi:hypothetical protein